MNPGQKLPALDGLRGVAILMVVLTHAAHGWGVWSQWPETFHLPAWLATVASGGFHGVALFFVLSAFLLTIQATRHTDGWLAFAVRRVARIGPAYWLAGAAYTLTATLAPSLWVQDNPGLADIAVAAVFGSAWQGGASMSVVPGGWSVSCEAAFYVALPLALWLIAGRLWRAMLLAAASALVAVALTRQAMLHGGETFADSIQPGIQFPCFAAGIAAAVLAQRFRLPHIPGLALALLAAAVMGVPFVPIPAVLWSVPRHLLFAPLVAGCVALAAQHPPRLLKSAPMRRLGEVSYSLYLIHFALLAPSLTVAEWLLPSDGWPTMALHFALLVSCGFGLSCVTYDWIERPGIQWAARLLRRRSPVPPNPLMQADLRHGERHVG